MSFVPSFGPFPPGLDPTDRTKILARRACVGSAGEDVFLGLGQLTRDAACSQRKHQASSAAEQHADAHQRADYPGSVTWPRPPNHHSEDQGDHPFEE